MGYACPVCETPHTDGEHLANHLAVTAILHEADHETWLDAHVADWDSMTPGTLATHVTEQAAEIEFDTVFDDTTPTEPTSQDPPLHRSRMPAAFDAETHRIIDEARALTNQQADESQEE